MKWGVISLVFLFVACLGVNKQKDIQAISSLDALLKIDTVRYNNDSGCGSGLLLHCYLNDSTFYQKEIFSQSEEILDTFTFNKSGDWFYYRNGLLKPFLSKKRFNNKDTVLYLKPSFKDTRLHSSHLIFIPFMEYKEDRQTFYQWKVFDYGIDCMDCLMWDYFVLDSNFSLVTVKTEMCYKSDYISSNNDPVMDVSFKR